jgi:hypothetical protein
MKFLSWLFRRKKKSQRPACEHWWLPIYVRPDGMRIVDRCVICHEKQELLHPKLKALNEAKEGHRNG